MSEPESYARRLDRLGAEAGGTPAITFGGITVDFAEFNRRANRLARHFLDLGASQGDFITIAEPNSVEFLTSTAACWKMGAIPQPVSSRLPRIELDSLIALADPAIVIGADGGDRPSLPNGFEPPESISDAPLPDAVSPAWKAPTSGGSTGRPKLIVSGDPSVISAGTDALGTHIGATPDGVMVIPGPLYHNGPLIWSCLTLLSGGHIVLLGRFDAERTLGAIAEHAATAIYLVPTMMQRMWKLPDDIKFAFDLSSLKKAVHLAEPCPAWLKEAWLEWIGPDALWELYGGTEGQSFTLLDGREWLEHRGSVGRPLSGEMKITSEEGVDLPPGEVGDVWMRPTGRDTPTYRYVGAEPEERDGWECLGDVGWMDADGYLYLADRRNDMILVGGANVYPAEIEAAIGAHPHVLSCAVIGLPDDDKGARVHAIVQGSSALDEADLRVFLAERLVTYKVPRSFEYVDEPLRDDAGKVRRGELRAQRVPGS